MWTPARLVPAITPRATRLRARDDDAAASVATPQTSPRAAVRARAMSRMTSALERRLTTLSSARASPASARSARARAALVANAPRMGVAGASPMASTFVASAASRDALTPRHAHKSRPRRASCVDSGARVPEHHNGARSSRLLTALRRYRARNDIER